MRFPKLGNYRDEENEPWIRTTEKKRWDGNHLEKECTKVKFINTPSLSCT